MLENYSVDLVISDILMPNLNGYALTERIRAKYAIFRSFLARAIFLQMRESE